MAFDHLGNATLMTLPSDSDNSANQYRFFKVASDGEAVLTGAGENALGVLQNKPTSVGNAATLAIDGVSKVVAGAAITINANVQSDSTGRAITATTGNFILGLAVEAAAAAGDVITVALVRGGIAD